jgi:DNA-binding NtrC family response regulator
LFLDEVGDIPLAMQVKLLRLLESGTYRRVGSTELRHADIRVISATHRNLAQMVSQGTFREDLYYRLSTFPIHLPALRERREDIELLCDALLKRMNATRALSLSGAALRMLKEQEFPGNVRELRNLLERTAVLCDGDTIGVRDLQRGLQFGTGAQASRASGSDNPAERIVAKEVPSPSGSKLKDAQQAALSTIVSSHVGSRAELAQHLGISQRSLYRRLKTLK